MKKEKRVKKICSCGFPQSFPIPHEHYRSNNMNLVNNVTYEIDKILGELMEEIGYNPNEDYKIYLEALCEIDNLIVKDLKEKTQEIRKELLGLKHAPSFEDILGIVEGNLIFNKPKKEKL